MKKKILTILLALILVVGLTGCGTYNPPVGPDDPGGKPVEPGPGPDPGPGEENDAIFSVQLVQGEENWELPDNTQMRAKWTDGISQPVYADFDKSGRAETKGLDGDYSVTIEGLPTNKAYNPNAHIATNFGRDIKIEIFNVSRVLSGSNNNGTQPLKGMTIRSEGVYRATINKPEQIVYYIYEPSEDGTFYIQSWVDTTENLINPKIDKYEGSKHYVSGYSTINDGGPSSTYTKNFLLEFNINFDEMGGSLVFGIKADTRSAEYPLSIAFRISRESDYSREDIVAEMAIPTEFDKVQNRESFKKEKHEFMQKFGTNLHMFESDGLLNGDNIGFNENDGYFHMLDTDGKPLGPVVCANIDQPTLLVFQNETADSFISIEYHGNKALTVDDNFDKFYKKMPPKYDDLDFHFLNYKIFIEGYENIIKHEGKNDFHGLPEQYAPWKDVLAYSYFTDDNGMYPVTYELYRFLQGYATQARLFMDGNGFAEASGLKAAEEDQWLFACGYYS